MKKKAANRPLKYGEETKVVQTRVPKSKVKEFEEAVKKILKKWITFSPF